MASVATPWDAEGIRVGTPCKGKSGIYMWVWAVLYDEAFAPAGRTSPFLIFHQGVAPLCPGLCAHCPFRAYILSIRRIRTLRNFKVLPTFGVMGNMLSSHKRLEDATTSAASGQ